jgi:hypothetical protein
MKFDPARNLFERQQNQQLQQVYDCLQSADSVNDLIKQSDENVPFPLLAAEIFFLMSFNLLPLMSLSELSPSMSLSPPPGPMSTVSSREIIQ